MARTAIPVPFEMPEYRGSVRSDLLHAARTNSNLSGMAYKEYDSEYLAKDLQATAAYLMNEGCATQSFFLLDELKRLG